MKTSLVLILAALILLTTACGPGRELEVTTPASTIRLSTPGPNPEQGAEDANGRVAGFMLGLWHGIIAPVMLVGSFFNPATQMYEVHNNGAEYNFGYLVGVALIFLILGLIGGRRR